MGRYRKTGDQSTIRTRRPFLLAKLMRRTDEAGSGWHTMRRIQVLYVLPEEKKQSKTCSHKGNTAAFFYPGASEPHPPTPPHLFSPQTDSQPLLDLTVQEDNIPS